MKNIALAKKIVAIVGAGAMMASMAACGSTNSSDGGKVTLKFAAFEGGYGVDMYKKVVAAYEKLNPNVKIDLQASKKIATRLPLV